MATAREHGFDLTAAVEHYAAHVATTARSLPVGRAVEEFLAIRGAEGKSARHLKDLRLRLGAFARAHGGRLAAAITTRDIDSWLTGLPVGPQSRSHYRAAVHNFFAFCAARGFCAANPVAAAVKPKVPSAPIGILTPAQTEALLAACPPAIIPAVSIALFAGLRDAEIARLDWRHVDLGRRFVEVTTTAAKTAQRRLVSVADNLHAWLEPHQQATGPVRPGNAYHRLFAVARADAGIAPWPHNAMRHSFASYLLAKHQDAARTALQLGHARSDLLFRHYRELVQAEDAEAFWCISPPAKA